MIAKTTKLVNDALRARWSTVTILALILTVNRAFLDAPIWQTDKVTYLAKLVFTLVLAIIISVVVHVVLYAVFSPKKETPTVPPATKFAPGVVVKSERAATKARVAKRSPAKKKK